LGEMYEEALADHDAMTVGETVGMEAEDAAAYVGDDRALNMAIHFEHMNVDRGEGGKYDPIDLDLVELKGIVTRWQNALAEKGWNCLYFSNHDQPRTVSRFGDDGEYREESAKMLATVLCTLRGTPFLYQGQEIGMTNTSFEGPADVEDVWARNFLEEALESDRYDSFEEVRPVLEECSRDNARTPMQWADDDRAGFTDGEPWIGVTDNYDEINVEAARADPDSIWHYYRELFELREEHETLVYGEYELLCADHPEVFAYERSLEGERLLVVCNFFDERPEIELDLEATGADRLFGNYAEGPTLDDSIRLRPYEAAVYRLS
ncbi:alpha-amylase family glycosyl hydrolase, partial [Natronococcus sp.]|uniref:alpha-amylase family glycosyl hydrolase n=1 Tax=Natronococcus sp. TaxID=35747 RepID=UPI003A4D8EB0